MSWTSGLKAFWYKTLAASQPWADMKTGSDGALSVVNFNHAFAVSLRPQVEGSEMLTDQEVVKRWVDRRNYETETPKLEVVHGELTPEGRVNVKLEWNDAFVRMLQNAGIEAETEDDMIRLYLASVTSKVDKDLSDADDVDTTEATHDPAIQGNGKPKPSAGDVAAIIDNMDPDILKMFEKDIRRRAAKRKRP